MRRIPGPLGWLLCVLGVGLIATYFVMSYRGLAASFNFGDPTKFQFILVPLWQIGLVIAALGAVCLLTSRWLNGVRD